MMKFTKQQERVIYAKEPNIFCVASAGSGKALPNSTEIPTPQGWKRVNKIKVGDYLFDKKGKQTKVLGVYPQGKKTVYQITFEDGRKARCCIDHIWSVYDNSSKENLLKEKTLKQILEQDLAFLNRNGEKQYFYSVPNCSAVEYNLYSPELDPYLFGNFLVDECCDEKILQHYNYKKNIPDEFKYTSIKNRWRLIQGLMDKNGEIDKDYNVSFSTSSLSLRDDFIEVMRSLGCLCSFCIDKRNKNINEEVYKILINTTNREKYKFFSNGEKRKLAIEAGKIKQNKACDRANIVKIEKLNFEEEMTCFYVDNSEHLFLMNDYIVTHNTKVLTERMKYLITEEKVAPKDIVALTLTNMAAEEMKKRLGDICSGSFIGTIHSYANQICHSCCIDTDEYIEKMEFEKILEKAVTIPKSLYPNVKYLMIDEFQDTCDLDLQVIEKINYENSFFCGDFRQLIYDFRGSNPSIFYRYYNNPEIKKYYLTKNFRCPPNIIAFSEKFVEKLRNIGPKAVSAKKNNGLIDTDITFNQAIDEITWQEDYGNWAVLCRTNADLEEAIIRLEAKGIPNLTFKSGDLNLEELNALLDENKVKVLTCHVSKGLSFPNVIVVGAKTFNDGEKRVSYVAATRAEKNLYWCPSISNGRKASKKEISKETTSKVVKKIKENIIKFC